MDVDNRFVYTAEQLGLLERIFTQTSYPDRKQRNQLEKDMGIPSKKLQIWFQNRRARERKLIRRAAGVQENPLERMRLSLNLGSVVPYRVKHELVSPSDDSASSCSDTSPYGGPTSADTPSTITDIVALFEKATSDRATTGYPVTSFHPIVVDNSENQTSNIDIYKPIVSPVSDDCVSSIWHDLRSTIYPFENSDDGSSFITDEDTNSANVPSTTTDLTSAIVPSTTTDFTTPTVPDQCISFIDSNEASMYDVLYDVTDVKYDFTDIKSDVRDVKCDVTSPGPSYVQSVGSLSSISAAAIREIQSLRSPVEDDVFNKSPRFVDFSFDL